MTMFARYCILDLTYACLDILLHSVVQLALGFGSTRTACMFLHYSNFIVFRSIYLERSTVQGILRNSARPGG